MKTLEGLLRDLDASCIIAGAAVTEDDALRLWIGDKARAARATTTFDRPSPIQQTDWSIFEPAILWLHCTALRLYSASPYAARHTAGPVAILTTVS
jgi:hypothetical protein